MVYLFRIGVWYNKEDEKLDLNIVPFTITQFKSLFDALFRSNTASPERLLNIMKICQTGRSVDAPSWKRSIESQVETVTKRMVR